MYRNYFHSEIACKSYNYLQIDGIELNMKKNKISRKPKGIIICYIYIYLLRLFSKHSKHFA